MFLASLLFAAQAVAPAPFAVACELSLVDAGTVEVACPADAHLAQQLQAYAETELPEFLAARQDEQETPKQIWFEWSGNEYGLSRAVLHWQLPHLSDEMAEEGITGACLVEGVINQRGRVRNPDISCRGYTRHQGYVGSAYLIETRRTVFGWRYAESDFELPIEMCFVFETSQGPDLKDLDDLPCNEGHYQYVEVKPVWEMPVVLPPPF